MRTARERLRKRIRRGNAPPIFRREKACKIPLDRQPIQARRARQNDHAIRAKNFRRGGGDDFVNFFERVLRLRRRQPFALRKNFRAMKLIAGTPLPRITGTPPAPLRARNSSGSFPPGTLKNANRARRETRSAQASARLFARRHRRPKDSRAGRNNAATVAVVLL